MKNDTHRYVPIGNKWHHILVNVEEWRMRLKGMRWHITSSIAEKSFRKICVKCCTPSPNEMRLRASGFLYRFYQHIWTIFYPSFVSYAHLWWQANVQTEVENQRRGEKVKKNFLSEANYDLTIECATQSNLWDHFVLRCAALRVLTRFIHRCIYTFIHPLTGSGIKHYYYDSEQRNWWIRAKKCGEMARGERESKRIIAERFISSHVSSGKNMRMVEGANTHLDKLALNV